MLGKHDQPSVRESAITREPGVHVTKMGAGRPVRLRRTDRIELTGEDPNVQLGYDVLGDQFIRMIDIEKDKAFLEPVKKGMTRPEGPLRTDRGYEIKQKYLSEQTAVQRAELERLISDLPEDDPIVMAQVVEAIRSLVGPTGERSAAVRWMRDRDPNWKPDRQAESIAFDADSGETS